MDGEVNQFLLQYIAGLFALNPETQQAKLWRDKVGHQHCLHSPLSPLIVLSTTLHFK